MFIAVICFSDDIVLSESVRQSMSVKVGSASVVHRVFEIWCRSFTNVTRDVLYPFGPLSRVDARIRIHGIAVHVDAKQ